MPLSSSTLSPTTTKKLTTAAAAPDGFVTSQKRTFEGQRRQRGYRRCWKCKTLGRDGTFPRQAVKQSRTYSVGIISPVVPTAFFPSLSPTPFLKRPPRPARLGLARSFPFLFLWAGGGPPPPPDLGIGPRIPPPSSILYHAGASLDGRPKEYKDTKEEKLR